MDTAARRAGDVVAGWAITVLAWALCVPGVLLFIGAFVLSARNLAWWLDAPDLSWPVAVGIKAVVGGTGAVVFEVGRHLMTTGRRYRTGAVGSLEGLAGTRYVLYLRSFTTDQWLANPPETPGDPLGALMSGRGLTREQYLVEYLSRFGRVVAIGRPGERTPQLGAERGYVTGPDWQGTVSALLRDAHVVVLSATPSPGTVWEYVEALRTVSPRRLVLLLHPEASTYFAFRAAAVREHAARADDGPLPDLPSTSPVPDPPFPADRTGWDFPAAGVITFDDDWRPRATGFLPIPKREHRTIWHRDRLVERELDRALEAVHRLPDVPR
ncbi:hypothetical protein [Saccharothrix obliqua]|uniref:hypothetical protein n=1 Tax=Saccharothrix obliqua TaxID=2861747 RepID=UPI001C5EE187|nr:hypothetical protein [Saccharothrix obliqua]MBW4720321.1 hypothetical protein [Saccharothrix obliqua]